jgi:hypothetical protein
LWLSISVSILALAFISYYRFDIDHREVPIFFLAIPVAFLLLAFSFHQLRQIMTESNPATRLIYAYDNKCNLISAVINAILTVAFTMAMMYCLYIIEEKAKT